MQNNYQQEAKDFLTSHDLTLTIKEAVPQKSPLWTKASEDYGINYFCTLSNNQGKSYGFDFWGSIADKRARNGYGGLSKRPTAYDVLACLDTYSDGETFEDFCSNLGYDTDSKTAEKTYKAVMKEIEGLKKVLSAEAIEALNAIN